MFQPPGMMSQKPQTGQKPRATDMLTARRPQMASRWNFGQQPAAPSQQLSPLMSVLGMGMSPGMRDKMFALLSQKMPGLFEKMGGTPPVRGLLDD